MTEKHFKGFVQIDEDSQVRLDPKCALSNQIAFEIEKYSFSKFDKKSESTEVSLRIEDVQINLYASDSEKSLDDLIEGVVLTTLGALDIYSEWYGWSEWTIEGYDLHNFTIGNHNLNEILQSYEGKYVHMVFKY